ncbi:50S ribosomal protein L3 [Candidatus Pacearchaeota archaeon]|nr:50S ribosomal protein L3 [Candidatus Pacearchaeota archaeon]
MAAPKSPRKGSLQYWPRKRAKKYLPSPNWKAIKSDSAKPQGFICYKAGMASAFVKDESADSMTKGKKIIIPVTIIECPSMKILSARFYKNGKVAKDVLAENLDKALKRKLKLPKVHAKGDLEGSYDDVRIICYSTVRKTGIKTTPDLSEIALGGSYEDKIKFIKENIGKEISISSVFEKGKSIDVRGLTKGKGLVGPVKRFGITLKQHKSEKGQRRPGSLGPWQPRRVSFRAPQAGQLGMFTRVSYNNKIVDMGKGEGKFKNIKNYGEIKTDYILLSGSVQGTAMRQLLLTTPLRETKKQKKKNYEVLEIR